jgi:two-component system, LytTR family, sensor kinase
MKKSVINAVHFSWWVCYLAFFCGVYMLPEKADSQELPQLTGLALLAGMGGFYSAWYLFPRYDIMKKRWKLLAGLLFISFITALPPVALLCIGFFWLAHSLPEFSVITSLLGGFAFLAFLNAGVSTAIKGYLSWHKAEKEKDALEKGLLESRLSQLKMQLHPHFLFNSINNIDILIADEPAAASEYLQKLAGLLRFSLYETAMAYIPLCKEIAFIQGYMELQQLRTTNANYAALTVIGECENVIIPPLMLIPFVENAFKHTPDKKQSDAIQITLRIVPGQIHFSCINKIGKAARPSSQPGGIGSLLTKQRLELNYRDNYNLNVTQNDDIFNVDLLIKTDAEVHSR